VASSGERAPGGRPPGPSGARLLASLLAVRRDKLRFVSEAVREYGDLLVFSLGRGRRLLLVNHPDLARQVLRDRADRYEKGIGLIDAWPVLGSGLLTSEGARWRRQREEVAPILDPRRLAQYVPAMAAGARAAVGRWSAAQDGRIDLAAETLRLTLDVLGRALFGVELWRRAPELTAPVDVVVRWAMRRMTGLVRPPLAVPTPANLACRAALRRLEAYLERLLGEAAAAEPPGAAAEWLRAAAAEGRRDEISTLLLAGHETTAAAICWTAYLLARDPEWRQAVEAEAAAALGGRDPEPADLPRLKVLRAAIEEAMRLYPPVWIVTRRARAADRIGDCEVAPGTDVLISVYTLQRHPRFWDEPEAFRPQRFLPGAGALHGSAYLPFGVGPRACPGGAFALAEATVVLAVIAGSGRLEPLSDRPVEAEPLLTLRPKGAVPMRFRPWPAGRA
jgi:cytochrome P450